jgi:hypothetical protein
MLQNFVPSRSALACNILWFISLSLALLCAFLATFVQQWARKHVHRTKMVRSPSSQAQVIRFLYFGLQDLHVHAVVDAIPSLLHVSIFSFFAGLIAFLVDVNTILVYITVVALAFIAFLYLLFTVLPIFTLKSFYRTPLSPLLWNFSQLPFRRPFVDYVSRLKTFSPMYYIYSPKQSAALSTHSTTGLPEVHRQPEPDIERNVSRSTGAGPLSQQRSYGTLLSLIFRVYKCLHILDDILQRTTY